MRRFRGSDTPERPLTSPPAKQSLCAERIPDRKLQGGQPAPLLCLVLASHREGRISGPPDLPRPPPRGSERAHPHPKLPRFFCPRLVFSAAGTGPLPPTPLSLRSWWGSALSVCPHPLPFPPFPPSLRPRPRPSPPRPRTPEPVLSPAPRPSGRGCGRGSPAGWAPLSLRADPRARAGAPCAASRSRLPPPLLLVTSGSLPV